MPSLLAGVAAAFIVACQPARDTDRPAGTSSILLPPGLEFPYIVEPACPGEACTYSSRLACDSVPLYRRPGDSLATGEYLAPTERFEVVSGALIVHVPEVVVVTRPVTASRYEPDPINFAPGDTLYVLDYASEGIFNFWYDGELRRRFSFWPSTLIDFGDDFDYRGEVIQPGVDSYWVWTPMADSTEAWVRVDSTSVPAPSGSDSTACDVVPYES